MKINSSINFIQPSGGNVLEAHHIEFATVATTPSLPSGSIWFEPNDDIPRANELRTERFRYQTVSGIRQIRIDEGYCSYGGADGTGGDLGQEMPPQSTYTVTFSGLVDSKFYDQFEDDVTIKVSGLYRIAYNFYIQNDSSGGNNDGVNQIRCLRNGVEIPSSVIHYYQHSANSNSFASKSFLTTLDVDDIINFEFDIIAGGGNRYTIQNSITVKFNIEFIRR